MQAAYVPPALSGLSTPTSYQYDLDQALTGIDRPDGLSVTYAHDSGGRLSKASTPTKAWSYSYDPASGQLNSVQASGGSVLDYTYDGSLLTRTVLSGPVQGTIERRYDGNFRLATESVSGTEPVAFKYDPDGLLTGAGALTLQLLGPRRRPAWIASRSAASLSMPEGPRFPGRTRR